jgi:hypothetical protein
VPFRYIGSKSSKVAIRIDDKDLKNYKCFESTILSENSSSWLESSQVTRLQFDLLEQLSAMANCDNNPGGARQRIVTIKILETFNHDLWIKKLNQKRFVQKQFFVEDRIVISSIHRSSHFTFLAFYPTPVTINCICMMRSLDHKRITHTHRNLTHPLWLNLSSELSDFLPLWSR